MSKRYNIPIMLTLALGAITALACEDLLGQYYLSVLMFMGVNIILSTSLNLVNGYMGEFSCGHAGFMAVGAYVSSVLGVLLFAKDKVFGAALLPPEYALIGFPIIIFIGGMAAALAGLLVALPSFKTRGDYLAIITIAANYIVISAVKNMDTIGGSRGFMGMKRVVKSMEGTVENLLEPLAVGPLENLPYLPVMAIWVFIFTVFCVWVIRRFIFSTLGKGVPAICQDEIAAEIMSVNTNRMKMIAFMVSSGLAGIAGGLFAFIIGYVNPDSFGILKSTEVLVMVYLGGMGSLGGSILSAILLTVLLEVMRPLLIWKWVLIPLLLIILMQFRPEGIMGNRELPSYFPRLRRLYAFKD